MLACACTPARKKVTGDIVRSIHFDGNGRFFSGHNDYQLQGAMSQGDSSFGIATFPLNYIAKPVTLDRDVLQVDSFRLETWYAENGWFDARFLGWEVHQIRKQRPERAGMVRILGHVEPGIPSTIRNFTINGADSATHRVFASTIKRTGSVQEGGQFSMLLTDTTKESLLTMFSNNGFPYATVDIDVVAYPDEHVVDVVFDVDPGITARFGEITVEGDDAIPARIVRQTVQMEAVSAKDIAKNFFAEDAPASKDEPKAKGRRGRRSSFFKAEKKQRGNLTAVHRDAPSELRSRHAYILPPPKKNTTSRNRTCGHDIKSVAL